MKKIEFRRNHSMASRGSMMGRRGIILIVVLFFLFFLSISYWTSGTKKADPAFVSVRILNNSLFLINKDTTNYEGFASLLLSELNNTKSKTLKLYIPSNKTIGELNGIIQICYAIEGVEVKLVSEKD